MTSKGIEFIVKAWVTGESGKFTVIGRCGDIPIRVNDVFDAVFRYKNRRYPDELGDEPVREVERQASLEVECIHAYEKSLNVLGQGMTGSLILKGKGLEHVVPGWVLGTRSESKVRLGVDYASTLPEER